LITADFAPISINGDIKSSKCDGASSDPWLFAADNPPQSYIDQNKSIGTASENRLSENHRALIQLIGKREVSLKWAIDIHKKFRSFETSNFRPEELVSSLPEPLTRSLLQREIVLPLLHEALQGPPSISCEDVVLVWLIGEHFTISDKKHGTMRDIAQDVFGNRSGHVEPLIQKGVLRPAGVPGTWGILDIAPDLVLELDPGIQHDFKTRINPDKVLCRTLSYLGWLWRLEKEIAVAGTAHTKAQEATFLARELRRETEKQKAGRQLDVEALALLEMRVQSKERRAREVLQEAQKRKGILNKRLFEVRRQAKQYCLDIIAEKDLGS